MEVAHEALIQRWPTLRDWVRANRENLRTRTAILRFRADWEEHREDEKFLLDPGVQLERGRDLLANPGDVRVDDIRGYVEQSIEKDQRGLAAERETALAAERHAKEAAEQIVAEQQKALANFREAQIMRSNSLLLRLASSAARPLTQAPQSCLRSRRCPTSPPELIGRTVPRRSCSSMAPGANCGSGSFWAMKTLVGARRLASTASASSPLLTSGQRAFGTRRPASRSASRSTAMQDPFIARRSADGKPVVTASYDRMARIWDAVTGQPIGEPLSGEYGYNRAAFSPDGKRIVSAFSEDGAPLGRGQRQADQRAAHSP